MKNYRVNFRLGLLSKINKKLEGSLILSKLILISHGFWIIIFLANFQIPHQNTQKNIYSILKTNINTYILTNIIISKNCWGFLSSISILGLQSMVIFKFIQKNIKFPTENDKIVEILANFTVLNYAIVQITIFPAFFYGSLDSESNSILKLAISFAMIFSYSILNSILPKFTIYRKTTCITIILVTINSSWLIQILICILTIYELMGTCEKIRKIILAIILILSLKILWTQIFSEEFIPSSISEGFYYCIILLVVFGYVFCFNDRLFFRFDQNIHEDIFKKTYQIQPKTTLKDCFPPNEILNIFSFFTTQLRKSAPLLLHQIQKQLTSEITIQNLHQIHLSILNSVYQLFPLPIYKILILELQILTKKNLMQILIIKNISDKKASNVSWNQRIWFYEIEIKLFFNYGQFNDKNKLKVGKIIQNYNKIEDFKNHFNQLIQLQIKFWKRILKQIIHEEKLFSDFQAIEKLRIQMKLKDQQLLRLKVFDQTQLLFEQQQLNIFQYESLYENESAAKMKKSIKKEKISLGLQNIDEIQLLEQNSANSFLIITDDQISFISSSLALKLHKTKNIKRNLQEMFGNQFSSLLRNELTQINPKNKNQWIPLPLFRNEYCFLLSIARIFWLPSNDNQSKFLIEISLLESKPYIMYNANINIITCYNPNFITQYKLSEKYLKIEIDKKQFGFQRLFCSSFQSFFPYLVFEKKLNRNHTIIQTQKNIDCKDKIFITGLVENKYKENLKDYRIQLKAWQGVINDHGKMVIIEVKNKEKAQISNSEKFQDNVTKIFLSLKEKEQFQDQQNQYLYSSDINGAFSMLKMNQFSKRILIPFTVILILGCVFITSNIRDLKLFNDRMSLYNSTIQQSTLGSDCFILLYKMYKRAGKNYQYLFYPQNLEQHLGVSLQNAIQSVKNSQRTFLDIFIPKYLKSLQFKPKKIDYNLTFQHFNITTNTDFSTLLDFAQHFLRNIQFNQYEFILQNYLSLRKFASDFQNASYFQEIIQLSSWKLHFQSILFLSAIIILYFILLIIELKNSAKVKKILKIYCLLTNQQVLKKISQLQSYINSFCDQKKYNLMGENEAIPLLHRLKGQQETPQQQKKQKLIVTSNFIKLIMYIIYLIVLTLIVTSFATQKVTSDHEIGIALEIINYHSVIYKTLMQMNRINTDTGLAPVFRHKFGKQLDLQYSLIQINGRLEKSSSFQQLQQISLKIESVMQENMCRFPFSNGVQLIPCQNYADGLLTRGYSQSYNYMLDLAKTVQSVTLDKFNTQICTSNYCPSYFVFDEISLRINSMFQSLLEVFFQEQTNLFQKLVKSYNTTFWLKILISLASVIILSILTSQQIKKSSKSLRLFIYIPTEIINSNKIVRFLEENDFINNLDQF